MPDSIRELILANLKTTLEAITTGGGYNYTINKVERVRVRPLEHSDYPSINIYEQSMDADINPKGYLTKNLDVVLELWTMAGGEDLSKVINKHLSDIEKAIMVDHTRGGYAIDTYYKGDEVFLKNGTELEIGAWCFIQIQFRTNITNPNSIS